MRKTIGMLLEKEYQIRVQHQGIVVAAVKRMKYSKATAQDIPIKVGTCLGEEGNAG